MNKIRIVLIALLMSTLFDVVADTPTMINTVPQRFVLSKISSNNYHCLKLDSKTGEVWFVKEDVHVDKITLIPCNGIEPVKEEESFDGRFNMTLIEGRCVYILDSKTGDLWAMELYRRGGNKDLTYTFSPIK